MAYDGYFPPSKTVRPQRRSTGRPVKRYVTPPRSPSGPRKRPTRQQRGLKPLNPPVGPSNPSRAPNYGTAVPAVDNLVNGIPRHMQYARWLMPKAARTHPWFRTASFGIDAYNFIVGNAELDLPEGFPGKVNYAWGSVPSGWSVCGSPAEASANWSSSLSGFRTNCSKIPLAGQQLAPNTFAGPSAVYYTPQTDSPGVGTTRGFVRAPLNDANYSGPRPQIITTLPQATVQTFPDAVQLNRRKLERGVPHQLVPYAATAPDFRLGSTRSSVHPGPNNSPSPDRIEAPRRGNTGPGRPFVRPKPRTKEKKGKVPPWFAKLAARAWDVTEANDLAENLFECLPKKEQKNAPKTGKTHKGSWAGEGHRYTSIVDKGRHVYRNLDLLDLDCAFRKVSCNHIQDMLWGRFFGTVDKGFQRGKVSGYSFGTRGSGADVTSAEYAKFAEWIESNPGLAKLLKSLDCENLGRS